MVRNTISATGTVKRFEFGDSGDTIADSDYDGDGITDLAVIKGIAPRFSWSIKNSSNQKNTLKELKADVDVAFSGCSFDGDTLADIAGFKLASRQVFYLSTLDNKLKKFKFKLSSNAQIRELWCDDLNQDGSSELLVLAQLTSKGAERSLLLTVDSNGKIVERRTFSGLTVRGLFTTRLDDQGLPLIGFIAGGKSVAQAITVLAPLDISSAPLRLLNLPKFKQVVGSEITITQVTGYSFLPAVLAITKDLDIIRFNVSDKKVEKIVRASRVTRLVGPFNLRGTLVSTVASSASKAAK